MNIYYENGCFSLWDVQQLESLPKTAAKKIVRMIGKNQHRKENAECLEILCNWLLEKITFFKAKNAEFHDVASEKQLKFYISLAEVL